jgi:hypothetical protein
MKIPLSDTPAKGAAGFTAIFGQARAEVRSGEVHINMPALSLSIFLLD